MNKIKLIEELLNTASNLPIRDSGALDATLKRAEMILRNVFGQGAKYLTDLRHITFYPSVFPSDDHYKVEQWKRGQRELINLLNTALEELNLFSKTESMAQVAEDKPDATNRNAVFVVHGHNEEMKLAVARTIEKLGLDPVILHEKPNSGRTIIEKFTDYATVAFAVVLLSPDDVAYPRGNDPKTSALRARQNVILELGFFLGRLGRNRVVVLYEEEETFEMPSDYSGVLYTPYDAKGRWQFDLIKELKASGYEVDANKLV
ncbi:MAG: nucleotide-binding protein [Candidatus Paceibacterota bacterium]